MRILNFTDEVLAGKDESYTQAVRSLYDRYHFDFVALGLTASLGAPLKWTYSQGATGERYRRIVLAPGQGIGGIVLKTGKPMMFADIDKEIDPREYASYPIVFAEDLHSFCALPLMRDEHVVAVLLCAFRTADEAHKATYAQLIGDLDGAFCNFDVVTDDFLDFQELEKDERETASPLPGGNSDQSTTLSRAIQSYEQERKRLAGELHDGIAQELLGVSFLLRNLKDHVDDEGLSILREANGNLDGLMDELRDITVTLRPSTLDHLGLVAALRSHATVFEKMYGTKIVFDTRISTQRFDQEFETQVYRICQEALLNACKYSQAETVYVSIEEASGRLFLSVTDHGCGFDVESPEIQGGGYGLLGMRERACLVGGNVDIQSGNSGTTVSFVAPIQER